MPRALIKKVLKKPAPRTKPDGRPDGRGGARAGAGRKPGQVTIKKEVLHFREKYPLMPVEYMLMVLNDKVQAYNEETNELVFDEKGNPVFIHHPHELKMDAAQSAAPYMHSKLASMDITSSDGTAVKTAYDLTKLTDEELDMFEKIALKSQIVTLDPDEFSSSDDETT